jgi:hypothetical protein
VVAKLAEKLRANGQTKPTAQEVADAALGRGPKAVRPFTEGEIKVLRMALHEDSTTPELRHKASLLMNDRATCWSRTRRREAGHDRRPHPGCGPGGRWRLSAGAV